MVSRMHSRSRGRGNVLRASVWPCVEILEGRQLLSNAPNAPFGLIASPKASFGITFAFYDSATNETGFVVKRADSAAGPFTTLTTLPASPGSGQQVMYTDFSTSPGSTYYYTATAVNGNYFSSTPAAVGATASGAPLVGVPKVNPAFGSAGDTHDTKATPATRIALDPQGKTIYTLATAIPSQANTYNGPIVQAFDALTGAPLDGILLNLVLSHSIGRVTGLAVQADGKILVAGNANADGTGNIVVARFNPAFSLDKSFGNSSGEFIVDYAGNEKVADVAVSPAGQIYVGGTHDVYSSALKEFFAIRLTSAGTIDHSFGYNGISKGDQHDIETATAIAIDPSDGSVVVAGFAPGFTTTSGLQGARLLPNGNAGPVYSFNALNGSVRDVIIQPDHKVILVGDDNLASSAYRFNADGTPDNSWKFVEHALGFGGYSAISPLSDGSFIAVGGIDPNGSPPESALIQHLNPDGTVAANGTATVVRAPGGDLTDAEYADVVVAPNGHLFAAGGDNGTLLLSDYTLT